jgi:peptide/nickel transport system ATP-binding protein
MPEVLSVKNLTKFFPLPGRFFRISKSALSNVHAVEDVTFEISDNDSLALVGESGCGKTTTGRLIVGLEKPTGGRIFFGRRDITDRLIDGKYVHNGDGSDIGEIRRKIQMIFQDPYDSLNPRMTIDEIVSEPLLVNQLGTSKDRALKVKETLEAVGLSPASLYTQRYPHELSGGQRQRIAIARAIILNPSFIVADEPTSMLDVSVRAGIMELFKDLTKRIGAAYLYITHDLAVARYMVQRIAVMYLGKIVEIGPTEEILANPLHPYTRALLQAVPVPDPEARRDEPDILGQISKPIDPPDYCRFYHRCPLRTDKCAREKHPPLSDYDNGHFAACYVID